MNSSKFLGGDWACARDGAWTSGADASSTPSAQQSFTSPGLQSPFVLPLACPLAPFGLGVFNGPNRASIAPTMHAMITSEGRPAGSPWKTNLVRTFLEQI